MLGVDIFEVEASGQVRWLEAANDLNAAMARLKTIAARQPGNYLIFDYKTGNKTFVDQTRLHAGTSSTIPDRHGADLIAKLRDALAETLRLCDTDRGTMQRLDPATRGLRIVASTGFGPEFVDYFREVHPGNTSCGAALDSGKRIVVNDVSTDPVFSRHERAVMLGAGSLAVQSIPVVNRANAVIGVVSPHYVTVNPPALRRAGVPQQQLRKIAGVLESLHEDLRAEPAAS